MADENNTTGTVPTPYAAEAKERWGNTDAYRQSEERVKKMTKEDMARIKEETDVLMKKIAALADRDPADVDVQTLIAEHYANLRHFYEPSMEMYRGLGNMYVEDPRFARYFDEYRPGLALFMRDAIQVFCATEL